MQQDKLQRACKTPDQAVQEVDSTQANQQNMLKMLSSYYEDSRLHATSRPLDEDMQSRYQARFGQAASHVKLFENPDLDNIGEKGFAKGNEVHIARGVFSNPQEFRSVMDHEMTHIAQQNAGGVTGQGLLLDQGLERAADAGDGAMMHTPALMDAGAAPIQGNLATNIFSRMVNKVRTKFDIGGYRTRKEAGRAAARGTFRSTGGTFGDERRMQALQEGQANDFRTAFAGDDDHDAHAREEARRLAAQHITGSEDYGRAVAGLTPQMQQYDDLQSLGPARDDDERAQRNNESLKKLNIMESQLLANFGGGGARSTDAGIVGLHQKIDAARQEQMTQMRNIPAYQSGIQSLKTRLKSIQLSDDETATEKGNHDNLDTLRQLERELYDFQGRFMGAADDKKFKKLQDSLQEKYEDHYQQIKKKDWSFHAGAGSGVDDGAADALWKQIASGTGKLTINDQQDVIRQGQIGATQESVGGFKKTAMGHIGRLLSTKTGFDLLSELSAADKTSELKPVRKRLKSDGSTTYDGAGAVPMVDGHGISTDSPHQGGFVPSPADKTRTVQGTGLASQAKISDTERDSSVRAVRRDGTQVLNPQFILAGHEMMHALHNIKGINGKFRKVSASGAEKQGVLGGDSRWNNPEELATMFGADLHYADDTLGQSAEMQADPVMQRYIMQINEQKLRDEFGIKGRDYHVMERAFKLARR